MKKIDWGNVGVVLIHIYVPSLWIGAVIMVMLGFLERP